MLKKNKIVKYKNRTTCELCKNCKKKWKKIINVKDHETNLGNFDVFLCKFCKLGFTDPYPTEETSGYLYETKNSSDFDVIYDSPIDLIKDFLSRRKLLKIVSNKNISSVLDFSTGNGRFAFQANKVFTNANIDAVDFQKTPPQLLSKNINTKIKYYNQKDFVKKYKKYDLIILRHVLEHNHHPVKLIKFLSKHLNPEGILYIEVPNLDSGCAKVFGKYWNNYYVPRHIFHYTNESLTKIIKSAGLKLELSRNEMPLIGNIISILTKTSKSNITVQFLGILLYPLQLIIEFFYRSSTCINARCKI